MQKANLMKPYRKPDPFAPERRRYLSPGRSTHLNDTEKLKWARQFAEDGEYANAAAMLELIS